MIVTTIKYTANVTLQHRIIEKADKTPVGALSALCSEFMLFGRGLA
ncbi:MAG: hypothetical protein K6T85_00205 [Gorillibacterium sp.]|nr:hypothetical protein [Gorillibacterium sp.]